MRQILIFGFLIASPGYSLRSVVCKFANCFAGTAVFCVRRDRSESYCLSDVPHKWLYRLSRVSSSPTFASCGLHLPGRISLPPRMLDSSSRTDPNRLVGFPLVLMGSLPSRSLITDLPLRVASTSLCVFRVAP